MSKTITEDEFYEQYKPTLNVFYNDENAVAFNGCMYETYGEELEHVKKVAEVNPNFVWTILDVGYLCITSGVHFVNRFGFLITELPADEEFIDVAPDPEEIEMNDEEE